MNDHGLSIFKNLFRSLQKLRQNPSDLDLCLEIQERLLTLITRQESKSRRNKTNIASLKKEFSKYLSKDESISVKAKINALREAITRSKLKIHILKSIGDGIPFTYISKWDIKPLVFKESSGFISGKRGARLERRIYRYGLRKGIPTVLNDLTNNLRYGDVTLMRGGMMLIVEAKSGKTKSTRDDRQRTNIEKVSQYLLKDEVEGLYLPGQKMVRMDLHKEDANYISQLNEKLIGNKESVVLKAEPGLIYVVTGNDADQGAFLKAFSGIKSPIFTVLDLFNNPGYYPFTLSIQDPNVLADLYEGIRNIMVVIDIDVLMRKFKKKGLSVEFLDDPLSILRVRGQESILPNGLAYMEVSRHFFGRIFYEFVSLNWFVNEISYQANSPGDSISKHFPLEPT